MMSNQDSHIFQFPQVCIVEASAGSGKTYALAKRYVQLLINPTISNQDILLENILAITFSNKATIEMKERILEFLKKIALNRFLNESEKTDILSSIGIKEEVAQKRAHAVMDKLIKNYNFFQVQTIDSFINAILSGCALKLELSSVFDIKTDYSDYLAFSLDSLIDRAGADKKVLGIFHKFLSQYLYLENRTGWFPKQDILKVLARLYSVNNQYAGSFKRGPTEAQDLILLKRKILKLIGKLSDNLPEGIHAGFKGVLLSFLQDHKEGFAMDELSAYFTRASLPVKKDAKVSRASQRLWQNIRKELKELVELESSSVFNYYIEIFHLVLEDFRRRAVRDDVIFLEELNRHARGLFDEKSLTVPEIYFRLAARLRHFLIDEFQDTSVLQWRNLYSMVEEALSSGGSLFYVGDKKQAIYRFRGGEVTLFDNVKERFRDFNLITLFLKQNFRSHRHIVEFTNEIFCEENLRRFLAENSQARKHDMAFSEADTQDILSVFEEARETFLKGQDYGYVSVERIPSKNKEERNELIKEKLMALIKDLRRRFSYKDMSILTRENDDVELVTAWLLEEGVPVESEKTLNIKNNCLIKEIVSFLKFLNSPIDNLSFASFILGDIFLSASGLDRQTVRDFIFSVREKAQKEQGVYLYREFRKKFPAIWEELIEEFFKNVGFIPLYELTISIFNRFECLHRFAAYQGFFMRFLELLKEKEEDRPSISMFLEYFDRASDEELYVKAAGEETVKVLTIHKAKGLGFPVVIIPFLEMYVTAGPDVTYTADDHIFLLRLSEKYRLFSPQLEEAYRREYKKAFIDELNSIYVALTRPSHELYVFIPESSRKGANLARFLIPDKESVRGQQKEYRTVSESNVPTSFKIPPSQYQDWIQFLRDEFMDEAELKNRSKLLFGEVSHSLLACLGNLKDKDIDLALKQAQEAVWSRFPWIEDFKIYTSRIKKLLKDKRFKAFFFIEDAEVFQEKEVIDARGQTKRLDRLIIKPKEVWIVDYKSTKERPEEDLKQVEEYKAILKGIYPDKDVKGFLIYLDDLTSQGV